MNKILIKLNKSGNHVNLRFINFSNKGKYESNTILLLESEVKNILTTNSYCILKDIHTYFEVYNDGKMIQFKIVILNFDLSYQSGKFEYRDLWIPTEKFIRFYFHSDKKELLVFNKEPIHRTKIEVKGNRIHEIRKDKSMYHKFLKILNRLSTWRYDKIVIVNDYAANSFYFQTYRVENGEENRAINGGIIWHKNQEQYSIHT